MLALLQRVIHLRFLFAHDSSIYYNLTTRRSDRTPVNVQFTNVIVLEKVTYRKYYRKL